MDKRAWVHQLKKQIDAKGADKASWYASWYDPQGVLRTKSCGPGKVGKSAAKRLADKTHAELITGTYQAKDRKTWKDFRTDFDAKIAARFDGPSRRAMQDSLASFERVANPKLVLSVTADKIDDFTTKRLTEAGIKGRTLSPATVNKDLRYIRLALRIAKDWGLIKDVPKIRFVKQSEKWPTFVSVEHFAAIYTACDAAALPGDVPNVSAADWWRGLLVTAYMTGWRIGQLLALKWVDVDLEAKTALTRAEATGNKGDRDERIPLHPVIVEHLKRLSGSFDSHVFPWNKPRRRLWPELTAIQAAAKLADESPMPQCGKNGWYGFHDFRRAFATQNAAQMDLFELQALMQHKALATTQKYVNMASKLTATVQRVYVPPNLRTAETG